MLIYQLWHHYSRLYLNEKIAIETISNTHINIFNEHGNVEIWSIILVTFCFSPLLLYLLSGFEKRKISSMPIKIIATIQSTKFLPWTSVIVTFFSTIIWYYIKCKYSIQFKLKMFKNNFKFITLKHFPVNIIKLLFFL